MAGGDDTGVRPSRSSTSELGAVVAWGGSGLELVTGVLPRRARRRATAGFTERPAGGVALPSFGAAMASFCVVVAGSSTNRRCLAWATVEGVARSAHSWRSYLRRAKSSRTVGEQVGSMTQSAGMLASSRALALTLPTWAM